MAISSDLVLKARPWLRGTSRPNFYRGDHLSGKPGNVREFDSCQGNVGDFTKNQGIVREKILSGIVVYNCLCACRYLVGVYSVLNIKYMVSDHGLLHSYPHH